MTATAAEYQAILTAQVAYAPTAMIWPLVCDTAQTSFETSSHTALHPSVLALCMLPAEVGPRITITSGGLFCLHRVRYMVSAIVCEGVQA